MLSRLCPFRLASVAVGRSNTVTPRHRRAVLCAKSFAGPSLAGKCAARACVRACVWTSRRARYAISVSFDACLAGSPAAVAPCARDGRLGGIPLAGFQEGRPRGLRKQNQRCAYTHTYVCTYRTSLHTRQSGLERWSTFDIQHSISVVPPEGDGAWRVELQGPELPKVHTSIIALGAPSVVEPVVIA